MLSGYTLPKTHLLTKSGEFQRVYRHGRRFRGHGYTVIVVPNTEGSNRLGISVQKKTGKAVRRNRIKRLVREAFRLNPDLFPVNSDIVVTIGPGFDMNSLHTLQAGLKEILGFHSTRGPLV